MLPSWAVKASLLILGSTLAMGSAVIDDEVKMKFADAPTPVRRTLLAEAPGVKIETVTREKDEENETIYWADATIGERTYAIGVFEDGTLSEMNLAFNDEEIPLDQCPEPVRETFKAEAFGEKVEFIGKQMRYGVLLFETVVKHKEKSYQLSVAEDGTLFEKVLVIEDEEVDFDKCPMPVQVSLKKLAHGGPIHDITRSTGIILKTFEASVEIKNKVYLIEVDEHGLLISKTLEAGED
jgi:hypothetical protein